MFLLCLSPSLSSPLKRLSHPLPLSPFLPVRLPSSLSSLSLPSLSFMPLCLVPLVYLPCLPSLPSLVPSSPPRYFPFASSLILLASISLLCFPVSFLPVYLALLSSSVSLIRSSLPCFYSLLFSLLPSLSLSHCHSRSPIVLRLG